MGRQRSKTVNASTVCYLYDGDALIAKYSGTSSTALRRYVRGPGVDDPIVEYAGSGTSSKQWLYKDHQGSIIAQAGTSGAATNTYAYSPWGEVDDDLGSIFRYTGQRYDAETNLYYYKARYYSPTLGRFLQTDPIGYADQQNLYAYVHNDPVNYIDQTGKYADLAIEAVSIAAGAASFANNVGDGNFGAATVDAVGIVADFALAIVPGAPGAVGLGIQATRAGGKAAVEVASKSAATLSDDALVVRGGTNTADRFTNGSKVTTNADGTLDGVSVNSAPGASVEELSAGIPNKQIGVSTVGDIRAAGGDVVPSRTSNNSSHCTMCGVTAEKAEQLFTPTIRNPSK